MTVSTSSIWSHAVLGIEESYPMGLYIYVTFSLDAGQCVDQNQLSRYRVSVCKREHSGLGLMGHLGFVQFTHWPEESGSCSPSLTSG